MNSKRLSIPGTRLAVALALTAVVSLTTASPVPPPLPADVPVLMVGHPDVSGSRQLTDNSTALTMGRASKAEPLELGEKIEPRAEQSSVLEHVMVDGRQVLRRSTSVKRAGSDQVLGRASIDMDPETLLPLKSVSTRRGVQHTIEYDWDAFVVRHHIGDDETKTTEVSMDMKMFEVGAHDVWMAALPLREGFTARLPMIFASTGTKYWAVPRVVGSENVDLGDGTPRAAWVVELDWWGMGAANDADNYSPGGGSNGSAGAGGKYWVLKESLPGTARVVRVRTEIDTENDSVIQVQSGI